MLLWSPNVHGPPTVAYAILGKLDASDLCSRIPTPKSRERVTHAPTKYTSGESEHSATELTLLVGLAQMCVGCIP